MTYKKRCNNCIHVLCDVVGRNRPERNVEFVCESIVLFERNYGLDYKEETRELALEAISKYGPGTPFENDERMLPIYRILGKYSRSMSSTDIYDKLHEKGLFAKSARFYVDWADVHLLTNQTEKATRILALMEESVGAHHEASVKLRTRLFGEENTTIAKGRTKAGTSRIAALIKPVEAPTQPARRNLFGVVEGSPSFGRNMTPEAIVEEPIEEQIKRELLRPVLPETRAETIVLPNIVDAPPIDMSIVSPSMNLLQSGQVPSNFSLPPVFSFSNSAHTSSNSYKPSMTTTTRETTVIRNSIMSTSMMPSMPPPLNPLGAFSGLPSHPAQIGQSQFAVPALPPFRHEFTRNMPDNTENMDPRGASSSGYARRDISGVLLPSRGIPLEKYGELEKEIPETRPMSGYEMKKARMQNQQNQQSSAARKIFADPADLLGNAFQSLGINSPSTSNH